jgi:uncharacterized protein YodC (DUF2158 family)
METNFKLQDSVQLLHGYTPTMTISEINEETQQAKCVWYDSVKTKDVKIMWIPLNALKPTPLKTPLDADTLIKTAYRL